MSVETRKPPILPTPTSTPTPASCPKDSNQQNPPPDHHHHLSLLNPFKKLLGHHHSTHGGSHPDLPSQTTHTPLPPTRSISAPTLTLREKYGRPLSFLGSGANGQCYAVRRPADSQLFAVKQFRPRRHGETPKEYRKKWNAEWILGNSVEHPNIVRTLDLVVEDHEERKEEGKHHLIGGANGQHHDPKIFCIMEYCGHGDLYSLLSSRPTPLPPKSLHNLFTQLLSAVHYLHTNGIAHRDLKPENVLVSSLTPLQIKLIDFGSADVFHGPFAKKECVTLSKGRCGSGPYIAPEEWTSNGGYDARKVDVWSLGIILSAMIVRRFPWARAVEEDRDYKEYLKWVKWRDSQREKQQEQSLNGSGEKEKEKEKEKLTRHPELPRIFQSMLPDVRTLVLKMLQPDPAKRPGVDEIMEDEWVKRGPLDAGVEVEEDGVISGR